ncbi:MAG: FAD-dependent oxidoreductase [Phascolarctobacterium sp.]|jgi:thioredoxin reductase (NADPH)|nr:FAD-dependent oxidoreductase [Phascolarctobacterium sp.]MBQ5600922.1 FAD-dependent oxidoreductase [Phascolarctobacterium sp.]MBQ5624982.1 FAD-dependent oxidoreductase [Phascolarctobacterium sp.]MBQ5673429.1 FAD-dependent oxidoreductase [Phascolarctobacterium sp.]MBQ6618225.1 FAD-dependent oxidoreductase [Phascolarctobacterium sp.]
MKFDIAVIGGGPAGIAAAITAQSKGRKVVLFEAHGFSPRLRSVTEISDYLGLRPMSGTELMDHFVAHLSRTDVFVVEEKVVSLKEAGNGFVIGTPSGNFNADAVVLCTGVSRSNLLVGEKEFMGRGVSYCAKVDGVNYKGKRVAAIATTDDAMEEIELLADYCEHVYLFPRYSGFRPPKRKNITIVIEPPTEITGTDRVTGLHTDTDFFGVQAVFMFRATDPLNSFLPELQIRGRSVYVDDQAQTNVEGVFAGGDCTGQPWQVNRAAGQGQKAALSAIRYLAKRDEEIGY